MSLTLWSTPYFPRTITSSDRSTGRASFIGFDEAKDLKTMIHWTLYHYPNVSSVVVIVRSILSFNTLATQPIRISGLLPWLLNCLPPTSSAGPSRNLRRPPVLPPRSSIMAHLGPIINVRQDTGRPHQVPYISLHPACLWFLETRMSPRLYRVMERGRLN